MGGSLWYVCRLCIEAWFLSCSSGACENGKEVLVKALNIPLHNESHTLTPLMALEAKKFIT